MKNLLFSISLGLGLGGVIGGIIQKSPYVPICLSIYGLSIAVIYSAEKEENDG